MPVDDTQHILARLARLEAVNHRWKRGALLISVSAVLMSLAWLLQSPSLAQGPRTVSAQRFVLLSPGGRGAGATLEFTNRGPEIVLFDPGEKPRLRIGVDDTGPSINLLDGRGKRASLGFFEGEPALVLYDGGLRVRAVVSMAQDRPSVVLLDENRRQVFQAP